MGVTVKPAFALALYGEFLTRLSRPLGAPDIFSGAYRPSPTTHQTVSSRRSEQYSLYQLVLHFPLNRSRRNGIDASQLRYVAKPIPQRQAVVNLRGVFSSRRKSEAYSPRSKFIRPFSGTVGISLPPWCKSAFNRQGITLP